MPNRSFSPAFGWVTGRFVGALVGIAVLIAAAALYPPMLFVAGIAGAVLAASLLADLALGPNKRLIQIEREPVGHLALRSPAHLGYAISNRSDARLYFRIVDTPIPAFEFPEEPAVGRVGPDRRTSLALSVMPRLRGEAELGRLYVTATNALGLVARRWTVAEQTRVRVYPDLSAVERYGELARRGRLVEAGFRKLRLHGRGGEFDALRDWTPDDEFRTIDWKATARRGKLMVDQYDIERSQTVMLVLDAGRLMTPRLGPQQKFDYAITAALSVAAIAALVDDKVGLLAFAGEILDHIAPRSGSAHTNALTSRVYDLQPRFEESDYARAFTYLRRRQPKRSLVIFFTDMFDPVASAATLSNLALITPRHLAVCVLMNDEAVQQALRTVPETPHDAYRAAVAAELLTARQTAIAILRQRGIIVIDVPAKDLTVSLINAYVEIKAQSLL
ncbi:MAG TPA: DUF58 domain-containing protein [Candidatus Acidoferrales bacterium]|nr:DUF58 domain-containing protein [Candidatus Acidoferrales bacterium]